MQKRNGVLWNTLGSAMYGVNSFIMLAMVSRIGEVEEAGYFGIAFTTAQILYIIGLFGVSHYQMTDYTEKFRFSSYAKGRLVSCILMLLCCGGVILALGFRGLKRTYTICLTLLMLLNVVGELFQSLFFQKNRLDLSGSALFYRTLWPLLVFCGIAVATRNILLAVAAQTGVNFLITLYYALRVAPEFITKPADSGSPDDSAVRLLWECFPLLLSLLLMNLLINLPKYGIEVLMDDVAQGYYNMIFMPAQVINMCSQFLFKPLLNRYSGLLSQKKNGEFLQLLKKQLLLITGFTLLCCLAAFLLGVQVLGFVYGKDLSAFVMPLTLVVFGGGIYAGCQLFYYVLVIMRKQREILYVYAAAMVLAVFLTAFLVSRGGIMGAVLAFGATHGLILLGYLCILRRTLGADAN